MIGCTDATLRYMMKNQMIDIGIVIGHGFYIEAPKLAAYKGVSMQELEKYINERRCQKNEKTEKSA